MKMALMCQEDAAIKINFFFLPKIVLHSILEKIRDTKGEFLRIREGIEPNQSG